MTLPMNLKTKGDRREYIPHIAATLLVTASVMIILIIGTGIGLFSLKAGRVAIAVAWPLLSGVGIARYAASRLDTGGLRSKVIRRSNAKTLRRTGVYESLQGT